MTSKNYTKLIRKIIFSSLSSLLTLKLIITIPKRSSQTKLIMTVEGGPFDSIAPSFGLYAVLYGDQWDRGYRYNASTDKDLNKFEGAHQDMFVEGIAEIYEREIVVTAGSDGTLAFWKIKTNKTFLKIPNLAGKNTSLTDLIITPNDIIIVSAAKEKDNIHFLPFEMVGLRKFQTLDGDHEAPVMRIRMIKMIPMFLTMSLDKNNGTKIVRWSSEYPPLNLGSYQSKNALNLDASWEKRVIVLGTIDKGIETLNILTGNRENFIQDAHTGPVVGIATIPHVNYVVSSGGKLLKIWDSEFKVVETLKESKERFTGRLVYKMEDKLIGAINAKGIVFWTQCEIKKCLICEKNEKLCHTCRKGYTLINNECHENGSEKIPFKWDFYPTNIDRTRFRISFHHMEWKKWKYVQLLEPKDHLRLILNASNSETDSDQGQFNLNFIDDKELKTWDFYCKFTTGVGLQNFSAIILNKTSKRVLEDAKPNNKTEPKKQYYFEPGPKHTPIPSMPSFSFSLVPFYFILGSIYRIIFWLSITAIFLDLIWRYKKTETFKFVRMLRYSITYSTVTLIHLFSINNRPVVTESNIGLHKSVHIDFIFFPDFKFATYSNSEDFLYEKVKLNEYGFTFLFVDHWLIEIVGYLTLFVLRILTYKHDSGKLFAGMRFIFVAATSLRVNLTFLYLVVNYFKKDFRTNYIYVNYILSTIGFFLINIEMTRLLILAFFSKTVDEDEEENKDEKVDKESKKNEEEKDDTNNKEKEKKKSIIKLVKKNSVEESKVIKSKKIEKGDSLNQSPSKTFIHKSSINRVIDSFIKIKIKKSKAGDDFDFYMLEINNIINEYFSAHLSQNYSENFFARLYHILFIVRCYIILILLFMFENSRRTQAWIFFITNFVIIGFSVLSLKYFTFKILYIGQDSLYLLWSLILVINAHDDVNPSWGLTSFWIFSFIILISRFLIMLIDIYLLLFVLYAHFHPEIENKKEEINEKNTKENPKEVINISYVQEHFNKDNEPMETENRGLNYEVIIHNNLKTVEDSRVWGNPVVRGSMSNISNKINNKLVKEISDGESDR